MIPLRDTADTLSSPSTWATTGDIALCAVAVAAAVASLVGALCLFSGIITTCIEWPLVFQIGLALIGGAVSLGALYLRSRYLASNLMYAQ